MAAIGIVGSGIAGLAAACVAAADGHKVSVFEKNDTTGGRVRKHSHSDFVFDMGPSWYWMPDVFEKFFNQFGKSASDYYQLVKLDPGFRMFFSKNDILDVPADMGALYSTFENIEKGSSNKLRKYLHDAAFKYKVGMLDLAYQPSLSVLEYARPSILRNALRLKMFSSISSHVRTYFSHPWLIALMEFPSLFLGAMPWQIPALYSLMNYAALEQGTWYPMGGMFKIIEGIETLATSLGVDIYTRQAIETLTVKDGCVKSVISNQREFFTDAVVGACDYHHLEQALLEPPFRNYSEDYWSKRTFAPSCLIFYIGTNSKIRGLQHHNLFFDTDLNAHAKEIYTHPKWPAAPLFYVCCTSKTDSTAAPEGCENLFVLMPIATGLRDEKLQHDYYFDLLMERMEHITGNEIKKHVVYKRSYCIDNFIQDYNAYRGNAYGLANTLRQTAILKPSMKNKKLKNLFYAGQLTVPGPGLPPSLISGQTAAYLTLKYLDKR